MAGTVQTLRSLLWCAAMLKPQQVLEEAWKHEERLKGRGKNSNREAGQDLNSSQTSGKFGFAAQTHLQKKSFT